MLRPQEAQARTLASDPTSDNSRMAPGSEHRPRRRQPPGASPSSVTEPQQ